MEVEIDTARDDVVWTDKDIKESENREPDGGRTGEETPLAPLGPGMSKGESKGEGNPQVCSIINSGEGTPLSPVSEHRGKESSRAYPIDSSGQRDPHSESRMADPVILWSDVIEELNGLWRNLARKESHKDDNDNKKNGNQGNENALHQNPQVMRTAAQTLNQNHRASTKNSGDLNDFENTALLKLQVMMVP